MTVSSTTSKVTFNGNGVTTVFAFPYPFYAAGDMTVILRNAAGVETTKVLTTDYSISGSAPYTSGANITMVVAPAVGERLVLARIVPYTQTLDLVDNDPLPADPTEQAFDYAVMMVQQLVENLSRIPKLAISSAFSNLTLPDPEASKLLGWNAGATDLQNYGAADTSLTPISSYWAAILSQAAGVKMREQLQAARAYYVRSDGSDSNDGLANSAARAFLTVNHALAIVRDTLDVNSQSVTIQIQDGTWTAPIDANGAFTGVGSGQIILSGNIASPGSCLISTTSADAVTARGGAKISVQGLKIQTTTIGSGLNATGPGSEIVIINDMHFGAVPVGYSQIIADVHGRIVLGASYHITAGGGAHFGALNGGVIQGASTTITLSGTPAYSIGFAYANGLGEVYCPNMTFSGLATGARYNVQINGVVQTLAGGANYFPGNAGGTTATGGQYA